MHPAIVNPGYIRTQRHVLLDQAEVRSRLSRALREIGLAAIPVRELALRRHAPAMIQSRRGKGRIPLERPHSHSRPSLVGLRKQLLSLRTLIVGQYTRLRLTRRHRAQRNHRPGHARRNTQLRNSHTPIQPQSPRICRCILQGVAIDGQQSSLLRRARRQPLAAVGVLLLGVFVLAGLAAPWLAPCNPASIDLWHRLESPSAAHWAGTDELGRDTFSRLVFGARLSLAVSVTVVAVSLALGLAIGGLAGYLGGWVDTALTTFAMNTFLALPGILLAIAFAAFLGPGFANLVLALAIGGWAGYARLVRAQVLAVREREYVEAARALGASGLRIFFRHILPNIVQPILVQAAIGMAGVILAEATLSFLGLGIPAPNPSWGAMLNDARLHLFDSPHLVLFPAAAVASAVLGFNFLGDALRDHLDPRTRLEMGM